MMLQYNSKHLSVGPSPTPAVVNHKVHNEYQKKHCFWQKIGNLWTKTEFFFVLAAQQSLICSCNTTANTFQWVRPRPRRSSITKCIMNTKKKLFSEENWQFMAIFGRKLFFFVPAAL